MKNEDLILELKKFDSSLRFGVRATAHNITEHDNAANIHVNAIHWQVVAFEIMDSVNEIKNPVAALCEIWVYCIKQEQHFRTGKGSKQFGKQQDKAQNMCLILLNEIEELAYRCFSKTYYEAVKEKIYIEASSRTAFGEKETAHGEKAAQQGYVQSILSIPLKPFAALGNAGAGVKDTSVAISEATKVVEDLPRKIRWETQLLLLSIEQREVVQQALNDIHSVTVTADNVQKSVDSIQQLIEGPQMMQRIDTIEGKLDVKLQQVSEESNNIIDNIALRCAQIAILIFILAVFYRLITKILQPAETKTQI